MPRYIIAIILLTIARFCVLGESWQSALSSKKATLDLYWFESIPFIYEDANGQLTGVEYEIMTSFRDFLKEQHGVELELNWIEAASFPDIMVQVINSDKTNLVGVSAFSISEERKQTMAFTDPYLPDISVMVSSEGSPIVTSYEEVLAMVEKMTAVTIDETNYERLLLNLEKDLNRKFDIIYIQSHENILDNIAAAPERFGFIDLPVYLMFIRNGGKLSRQNFFTYRGTGYGFVLSKESDWDVPFNEFMADPKYKEEIAKIISGYIGPELYGFIETLYDGDQLATSILTKEKEIQLELIKNANLRLEEERVIRRLLIIGIVVAIIFLVAIGILFYQNRQTTRMLVRQKNRIELQQADIGQKNEQLLNRNKQLIALNEEKNDLMRILAHDLRSPLGQIIGLVKALPDKIKPKPEGSQLIEMIGESAQRINQMVTKILDVDSLEGKQNLVIREKVDVNHLMQDLSTRYFPIAEKKNIDFTVTMCKTNRKVRTDHLLLFLVMENLVSNAIKFSKSNTSVDLIAECTKQQVLFKVKDQGPGFTEEDKNLAFKRFQKLSAKPTGGESSTGLGLSIVKKYIKDLGGEVWLESEAGKGTTFFVRLEV
ncbi:MAG: ATP-binding protein [Cyclobacteriaceae bacterium]